MMTKRRKSQDGKIISVGTDLWLRTNWEHPPHENGGDYDSRQPIAAKVTYVWPDGRVNVVAFLPGGSQMASEHLRVVGSADEADECIANREAYCELPRPEDIATDEDEGSG